MFYLCISGDWISVYVFTACVNAADSDPAAMLETTWWRLWRKTKNTKIALIIFEPEELPT